ncbi:hypothetical protein KOR34_03740 [Posidoniimonas corsicana]|uniref:DUF447 family protein n=1 Tax=Posidoniimonas corsicana TaxID=1938618 RepID=A0A5C5VCQ2_9BACT|nr:DUF447 domain-containing protein [Posidoniimonas corsicana]TWT35482.1 hypothetical protein KOR34_03740 [Posidoniimonas corsicana]
MSTPPAPDAPSLPDGLLLECLVTTLDADGQVHLAPMGPIVDPSFERVLLRPYPPSRTLDNLRRDGAAVMHTTDDAALLARAAIGELTELPATTPTPDCRGAILSDACQWRQLSVESIDDSTCPVQVVCRVSGSGVLRDFVGFNRAKHALIEAAILATRIDHLPHEKILAQVAMLAAPVDKTGGHAERDAFQEVRCFIENRIREGLR